ncbi:hypothetical protein [Brevibacterium aurantiacum]|uniref:hypothetical protein n=1 Tax=Brevibacterium aurantiacum TaxID=273384 RepID=UPI000050FC84|nr:hypothetical protein [Brevibacterium aurantiacum]
MPSLALTTIRRSRAEAAAALDSRAEENAALDTTATRSAWETPNRFAASQDYHSY